MMNGLSKTMMFAKPFNYLPNSRGFTLIELMVAVVVSTLIVGGIIFIMLSGRTAVQESERLARIQENVRFASDYLVRELRNAGYRDELSLTIDDYDDIGAEFASINDDGTEITVRFSGRGSCAEPFAGLGESLRVVENTYFVSDGELRCRGSIGDSTGEIALATGLRALQFEFMCPDSNPNCTCELWTHAQDFDAERTILANTCYGVRIGLEFEGPGNQNDSEPVAVELTSAFRNIILGNMTWASIPDDDL